MQGKFIQNLPTDIQDGIIEHGMRNGVVLTQAPTGTISILAGTSGGIEPVFAFSFKRRDRLGVHDVYHPLYEEFKKNNPDSEIPDYFVNSMQLTPMQHVRTQAIIQKYTDASRSKTVNAPENHMHEDVKELYEKAHELGCKGVTYFRENSRDEAALESLENVKKKEKQEQQETDAQPKVTEPKERPEIMTGKTYKIKTSYGKLYITINDDAEGKPFEVFAAIGKAGGFFSAKSEAICRLVSLSLRAGIPVEDVIRQLKGIRGPMPSFGTNGDRILSLPDAIAKILERHIKGEQTQLTLASESKKETQEPAKGSAVIEQSMADHGFAPECPECGGTLEMTEGCQLCRSCGFSKC
jgi:ribonucleoside-diphosphate reductase alpha chain